MNNQGQRKVRKGITIGVIACAIMLVSFLGSFAYFINSVENNKNQEVTVETGTMALTFSDGNNGFNQELNFGESAEKTFTIENTGTKEGTVSVSWMNLINTYLEGSMTYSFLESDTEDGEYTEIVSNKNVPVSEEVEDRVLASGITIPAGVKKYYKLVINLNYTDFDQTADLQAKLETQFKITEGILKDPTPAEKTLAKLGKTVKEGILKDPTPAEKTLAKLGKTVKEGSPTFGSAATSDETADGLYSMEDDYGTSYYYRGAVEDNYVKFAGFYWRIIRINGDGSLRIIYDGTQAHENGASSTNRLALQRIAWNTMKYNDAKYVGYMYGGSNGSASTSKSQAQTNETNTNIKTQIENWYKTNIADKGYDSYVRDTIYCNDRTTPGKSVTLWTGDTGLGYGTNVTGYGALSRIMTGNNSTILSAKANPEPKFSCENKNDAFTKEDTNKGNGKLGQKVGMITADEMVAAGSGKFNTQNTNYYLYKGNWYWSLSPYYCNGYAHVFYVGTHGNLHYNYVHYAGGVAPVISLSAEYVRTMSGNGTMSSPFEA